MEEILLTLQGKRVLTVVDHDYNDLELWYPIYRLREEGVTVDIAGPEANTVYNGQAGIPVKTDYAYSEVKAEDYVGILVPGGWAPDKIRRYPEVLSFIQELDKAEKPIGQICHAGWVLVSADVLKGRKVTSTAAIKDDMKNAGATWVDEEVVVDGHIISSRSPDDLPAYMKAYVKKLAE